MSTEQAAPASDTKPKISARPHILFLDGIRGLAALYVCLGHAYNWVNWWAIAHNQHSLGLKLLHPLTFGVYAVDLFIVLSGFCLMLPLVSRNTINAPFQFSGYITRRAKRIYPPYLAAIVLTLLLIVLGNSLAPAHSQGIQEIPTWGNLLAHLFLVHNLNPLWARGFNEPMWSVATEWQIYFLFPLLLLPVRRYAGRVSAIAVGLLLGWGLLWVSQMKLFWGAPWLIGLFAMGMAGAELAFSSDEKMPAWRHRLPYLTIFILGVPLLAAAGILLPSGFGRLQYVVDPIFGLLATCLLLGLVDKPKQPADPFSRILKRLFESRPALWLGRCSYSLYLIHVPFFFVIAESLCQRWNIGLQGRTLMAILLIPIILLLTHLFHVAFERPFLVSRERQKS